jgi:hypothetical protein
MAQGLRTEQLARTNPMRAYLGDVLRDEQRLGRVERTADGMWRATPALVETFASAFSHLGQLSTTPKGDRT